MLAKTSWTPLFASFDGGNTSYGRFPVELAITQKDEQMPPAVS
jgi:hypothetical protein